MNRRDDIGQMLIEDLNGAPDWKMPDPPREGAVPCFFFVDGIVDLHWRHPEEEDAVVGDDGNAVEIDWPFEDDHWTTAEELEFLGFSDCDEVGS